MSLSVGVFSLTLDCVCCGYTAYRPITLCKLVFAFKVGCRNMWVLKSLRSSVALVLWPSNILLWFRSRKVRSKGLRLPFQVRVSVPFLKTIFLTFWQTSDEDFIAFPNSLLTFLSSIIVILPLISYLSFLPISLILCEYREQNSSFSSRQEYFTTLNTYHILALLQTCLWGK